MSPTMLLGRVVLPSVGCLLAAAVAWHSFGTEPARPEAVAPRSGATAPDAPAGRVKAEGRVVAYPGAEVVVGTEVLGTIVAMPAPETRAVRKGDLVAELRADDVKAALQEARARLAETDSLLAAAEQGGPGLGLLLPALLRRDLRSEGVLRDLPGARARRDAARAEVDRIEAELAKYRIRAPIDGTIVARHAHPGETVQATAPLVTIADLDRLRVAAEVDEFDVGRVASGARATVAAEAYPGRTWHGEVEEVGEAVVPRQTRPEDPAQPTDTRILPVKVALRDAAPLKLGQRVEVEIAVEARGRR